jgi:NitT/TauT family transport system permease protein
MDPRKLRLGLLLAAFAILLAFMLPLAPGASRFLSHPIWEAAAGGGVLFVLAAWMADARSSAIGIAGVLLTATTSLVLLRDPEIAGSAGAGFWRS